MSFARSWAKKVGKVLKVKLYKNDKGFYKGACCRFPARSHAAAVILAFGSLADGQGMGWSHSRRKKLRMRRSRHSMGAALLCTNHDELSCASF